MHAGEDEYAHKAIFIAEYEGVSRADFSIRTLQSERLIEWHFAESSQAGIRKRKNRVRGPAAFIQATTRSLLHLENETRQLFVQIDESEEATQAILRRQAEMAEKGSCGLPSDVIENWHSLLRGLESNPILIPFASKLLDGFPTSRVRARRDFPKLLELIESCVFLHQKQRELRDSFILASEQDYLLVKPLFEHCYRFGPDYHTTRLLETAQRIGTTFSVANLQTALGWGKTKTYEILDRCRETGAVVDDDTRGQYRLTTATKQGGLSLPETLQ
jgi:hypothetical protein